LDLNSSNFREDLDIDHGGNIHDASIKLDMCSSQIIDASASIVPFNPPPQIFNCLKNTINKINISHYPDINYTYLIESIAKDHNVYPNMVLPGNGASELITWAARDASITGKSTLFEPSFSDYERALKCWNGKYDFIPLDMELNSHMRELNLTNKNRDVLWITNPHNPTGHLWSRESITRLLNHFKLIICDEAFLSLCPLGKNESLIPLTKTFNNLIVIRSLTKLYAIPGLRLGYAITSSKRINNWRNFRDPWPINQFANNVGIQIMNDNSLKESWNIKINKWISSEGKRLNKNLNSINNIKAYLSTTNFQLIHSPKPLNYLRDKLFRQGIILRDCSKFKNLGPNWLRISLQTKKNNDRIINAIKDINCN